MQQNPSGVVNERFYEKVIKVKADVVALLNLFSDVSIDVRW
jgi:methanogenic corrinoid protein MtbC1